VKPTIAYPLKRGIYLNITNRCPTACRFCIKRILNWRFERWNFRLAGGEPSVAEILDAVSVVAKRKAFKEVVFCGYGESTFRLPEILEICRALRSRWPRATLRLNTVGLGNLIWKRDIAADLAGALDAVAVSLHQCREAPLADPLGLAHQHGGEHGHFERVNPRRLGRECGGHEGQHCEGTRQAHDPIDSTPQGASHAGGAAPSSGRTVNRLAW